MGVKLLVLSAILLALPGARKDRPPPTTTVRFQNDNEPAGYRGFKDNWIWSAYPLNNKGGHQDVWIGSWHGFGPGSGRLMRQLVRVDLSPLRGRYTRITAARLKLVLKSVDEGGGEFADQPINLLRISDANKSWRAGTSSDLPQDGASCWSEASWLSADAARSVHWAGSPGLGTPGVDYASTPVATAPVSSSMAAGTTVTLELTDLSFVDEWINHPESNAGFLIVAPGLEANYANSVTFHSSETTAMEQRPVLELDVSDFVAPATMPISYTLDAPGRVSLVVYNGDGKVVRELLHARQQSAGSHTIEWDGFDERGLPVPGATYTWRLLQTPAGLTSEYLLQLGVGGQPGNVSFLPWQWVSNHQGPKGIAADESGVYVAGGMGEGASLVMKMTPQGQPLWIHHDWVDPWQGGQSIAVDGGTLYLLQQNGRIALFDSATGEFRGQFFDATYDGVDTGPDLTGQVDLAAKAGRLVVSYGAQQAFRWLDPIDGTPISETPVPDARGIALNDDGNAYVISGVQVLRFPPFGTAPAVVISQDLDNPFRLSVDSSNGDILVVEREPGHQIKRFTAAGALSAVYGTAGGRSLQGLYDNRGFHDVMNIAIAPDGSFWVTEPFVAPRRTVHLDADGVLIREFYGGTQYFAFGAADPDDPSIVWMDCADSQVMQLVVNHEARTWALRATYDTRSMNELFTGPPAHEKWLVRHREGRTYLVRSKTPAVMAVDEENGRLLPLSIGSRTSQVPWSLRPADPALQSYFWTDADGDGQMAAGELSFSAHALGDLDATGLNSWIGGDLSYVGGFFTSYDHSGGPQRLAPRGFNVLGAPVYDWADLQATITDGAPLLPEPQGLASAYASGFWQDADGGLYGVFIDRANPSGVGEWSSRVGNVKLVKWDASGRRLWAVGRHAPFAMPAPGEMQYPWRIAGIARGNVIVTDVEHSGFHVYDRDGLFVGQLFDNHAGSAPADAYRTCENFGGSVSTTPGGEVYFYGDTCNSVPVYRVTGWDNWVRQSGSITVGNQAPGAPSALSATPSDGALELRWRGSAGALQYEVKRASTSTGPFATIAAVAAADTLNYVDGQLVNGNTYYYTVSASNTYGSSPPSAPVGLAPRPTGLTAQYYAGQLMTFEGTPALTRVDTQVDFDWSTGAPDPAITADRFTVRWTGQVEAPYSESFTFHTFADDGVRLWVDGRLIVDTWAAGAPIESFGVVPMVGGARYDVTMEYFEDSGSALAKLWWSGQSTPQAAIPSVALYPASQANAPPAPAGLRASVSDARVVLTWSVTPGATSYLVKRSDSGGPYSVIASGIDEITYTDVNVVNGTRYLYVVAALNSAGESPPSMAVEAVPRNAGLAAAYYSNQFKTFNEPPTLIRTDATVDFEWGTGAPDVSISVDAFTVRWNGWFEPEFTETYTFYTVTDDGVRLWIDDALLVDRWIDQGQTEWTGSIALTAGHRHAIRMEYYENGGGAVARLSWSSPSQPKQVVPAARLYDSEGPPPTTEPPTGLLAAQSSKRRRIDLNWTQSASAGVTENSVYRAPAATGPYALRATVPAGTRFSDAGLISGAPYYYVVTAIGPNGESTWSNVSSASAR